MTTRYAALLRGVNVGGHRKVPMADLRALLTELGHDDVRTYLQSGNVVFTGPGEETAAAEEALGTELERAIEKRFGFRVDCLVRGGAYLRAVAGACPFPTAGLEGRQLHVTFFSRAAEPERFAGLDREAFLPEEFRPGDRELYLYAPEGLGRSRLAEELGRPGRTRGLVATTRNWNTVTKLVELTRV